MAEVNLGIEGHMKGNFFMESRFTFWFIFYYELNWIFKYSF